MSVDQERARIARRFWIGLRSLNVDNVASYPAAARAIESGARPEDLVLAMTAASYEAVFNALYVLTGEEDLAALADSGAADMLHEDLLSADPTGREGRDLFE